ncbi:MAG: hypothetical protein ACFFG0_11485 [Candidatus Thorarchaeota archaeon]
MMIKKEPCATISIKDGKITIYHVPGDKEKPCMYCGVMTKNRNLGLSECEDCFKHEYPICKKCKHGIQRSNFIVGPTDLDDHFEYYTACLIRKGRGELLEKPDSESTFSAWYVTPLQRKKCFQERK